MKIDFEFLNNCLNEFNKNKKEINLFIIEFESFINKVTEFVGNIIKVDIYYE